MESSPLPEARLSLEKVRWEGELNPVVCYEFSNRRCTMQFEDLSNQSSFRAL
jgi:hypothetical protein